ncbi:MAG: hypothetical protein HY238_04875, partial [Acidobacteria bacterium]|nr:hypothetical protein [Acidobacteriota bacterium]
QFLADHQVDFDLADEYILEWYGKADGRRLAIGRASYELVVWPEDLINLRRQTLPLLEGYLAAGGEILALGAPAAYIDGRPSDRPSGLRDRYASQWRAVSGLPDLWREIQRRLPPRVVLDPPLPPGVGFSERFLENGERVLFFANTGLGPARATARIEGGALERWDTITGRVSPAHSQADSGGIRFELALAPAGSELFVVKKSGSAAHPEPPARLAPLTAKNWKIRPDASNVLVLDYCDFLAPGIKRQDINTWQANWLLWQAHGFERPAWDNAVQFKTRIFDRNSFPPSSGFEATFRFEVADAAALAGLELAIEAPELYRVMLNGGALSFAGANRWLDPHLRSIGIEKLARTGENMVQIAGRPFDVRMELENIYLRGSFTVAVAERGFRLSAPPKLEFGSWARQGYPFYAGSALYQADVEAPPGADRLRIELGEWQGSVAEVLLDGKPAAVLGWQPYRAEVSISTGAHQIAVRVVSTPRNLFGPFHNRARPRMRAWPAAWADFPDHQPAGSSYDLLDYGLLAPFTVTAVLPAGSPSGRPGASNSAERYPARSP